MGPRAGTTLENPHGSSSPIYSSVLVMHFSAETENATSGFTLTPDDEQALADGQVVTLSNGGRDRIRIQLPVDFPDFIPFPLPDVPDNIQVSNPFGLVALRGMLYATDGGRNHVWQVNLSTRVFSALVAFPDIPNPSSRWWVDHFCKRFRPGSLPPRSTASDPAARRALSYRHLDGGTDRSRDRE